MVQMIARDVAAANVGLEIKVFPGSSLVKAQEQWKAMLTGQIDMTSFPLDYASGFHPQFGATLMPGLVKGHAHARRINDSAFMKDIKAIIEQGGVHVLADAWLAGAFGSKDKCIKRPEDAAGLKVRSAGSTFAQMWAGAGASIVSIPSSEVYNALQQGVAQATDTSTGSFVSFRLYEQLKCVTAPGDNALWFMYEPVLRPSRCLYVDRRRLPPLAMPFPLDTAHKFPRRSMIPWYPSLRWQHGRCDRRSELTSPS
jgi:TRAP-type C4-dicarboxylate transport system substrate-binding protein